jgi:type II secretory pathway pseudopilin PulG
MIRRRHGALLLDVLMALAIFSTAAIAILALVERSATGLARAREAEAAVSLARSALALIESGLESPERLRGPIVRPGVDGASALSGALPSLQAPVIASGWTLEVETEPSRFTSLTIVTARVRGSDAPDGRVLAELRQLLSIERRTPRTRPRGGRRDGSRSTRGSAAGRRAFTLIETLLALALLVGLLGAVMGFIWKLGGDRVRLGEHVRQGDVVAVVLERLESDLLAVIAGHPAHGAGLVGDDHSIRVLTRGVWLAANADEAEHWPSDLQATELHFDSASGEIDLRRVVGPELLTGASAEAIARGVRRVRLRYAHAGGWTERYDSRESGTLPVGIEVALWFGPPSEDEVPAGASASPDPPDAIRVIAVPEPGVGLESATEGTP